MGHTVHINQIQDRQTHKKSLARQSRSFNKTITSLEFRSIKADEISDMLHVQTYKSGKRFFCKIETLKCRLEVGFFKLYDH